ncbi:MAG: PAS domain-containing sensor histidine kinase [Janthinobacterium lividum]
MPAFYAPLPAGLPAATSLLPALLDLLPTGVVYYTPVLDATGNVLDFRFAYLNPAAQRLLGLPAQPAVSFLQQFPDGLASEAFAFHRDAFRSETPAVFEQYYQADGYAKYLRATARCLENGLLVSFTDLAEEPRTAVEATLRKSQARERAARVAAERQKQRFERIFWQAPAAICIFDGPDWVYEFVNPGYQRMFPGRQLLGRPLLEALPEVAGQPLLDILHAVYETGVPFEGKEVLVPLARTDDGPIEDIYFDLTYQARFDEAGRVDGFVTYAYDVTEQVLARQQRVAQQVQLREVFEQAPVAIAVFEGADYVVEVANPLVAALWGRTPAQVVGYPLFEALPEIRDQGFRELLDQVVRTGETYAAQEVSTPLLRRGQLETVYLNFVYQPLREPDGTITRVAAVATEVTEQVRARQTIEASARQLRLVTDALPVLIGYLDQEQKYRFANQAYQAWFHQDPANLLGRPVQEVAGPAAYSNIRPYIERALAGERVDFETEMPFRPDFTKVIRTTYVPDFQDGHVAGCFTLVTDITEQVRAREQVEHLNGTLAAINEQLQATNQELADSNAQLTRTNVDLDNFIYTASHDLKAPISNIEGLLYLLREELPAEVVQGEYVGPTLTRMLEAVERFKRTIDHLTDIIKLQKEFAPAATAVNLATVLEEVRQDLAPLIEESGARLWVEVTSFPPVQFSEKNLRSVVYNLLSNALKYRSPDRTLHVDVRAHVRPVHTVLEVHDNGLGIDKAHLPRLFGLFQRFHDHVEGTGIGLYMVKRIVENAGGRLEVHSQLGAGTTFFVYLPHGPRP